MLNIIPSESDKYLDNGQDFINETKLEALLRDTRPDPAAVRAIIAKSREINTLAPEEAAMLLNVTDPALWEEMYRAAADAKRRVYDNRVVTFAPLYCSNLCVNNCLYCGFRVGNQDAKRRKLTQDEIRRETEVLAGQIGHKRLVMVYGEHPETGAAYIAESMKTVYGVRAKTPRGGTGEIRRVNVNAAPMCVADYKILKQAGIGTFQIFQETYHRGRYAELHPKGTIKSDFRWRLYGLHRAQEAGLDDVAVGALFGLYNWKFEVLGLLEHARDMEKHFGIGPHTVSVPRIERACGNQLSEDSPYLVSDEDFKKLVCVIRLSIPYAGLIVTVRERAEVINSVLPMCTQRDASTRIGIGAYSDRNPEQQSDKQQFILGDTRSLDEVIREQAEKGYITSFCTAGYRCGRTGDHIMNMLRSGREGRFCKLNAVLTFREWLNDFATPETKAAGERVIAKELAEIKARAPKEFTDEMLDTLMKYYGRIEKGERDLCF